MEASTILFIKHTGPVMSPYDRWVTQWHTHVKWTLLGTWRMADTNVRWERNSWGRPTTVFSKKASSPDQKACNISIVRRDRSRTFQVIKLEIGNEWLPNLSPLIQWENRPDQSKLTYPGWYGNTCSDRLEWGHEQHDNKLQSNCPVLITHVVHRAG